MSLALRIVFRIPLVGWLIDDAVHGAPDAKYYFFVNLILSFVLLLYFYGYPFLICFALTSTVLALTALVILTAADMFEERKVTAPRRRFSGQRPSR